VPCGRITARVQTAAGPIDGNGRMARGVRFRLPGEAEELQMDMLVSPSLETDYGLFSPRDLHNH
jgi:hypothetical protein